MTKSFLGVFTPLLQHCSRLGRDEVSLVNECKTWGVSERGPIDTGQSYKSAVAAETISSVFGVLFKE